MAILAAFAVPVLGYGIVWVPTAPQKMGLLAIGAFCTAILFLMFLASAPPVVMVTAERVLVRAGRLGRQTIRRADLAYIFRGQGVWGNWAPAYFLVTHDDTPQIMIMADTFSDEGMTELARRIELPIKGDFTAQVK